MPNRDPNDHFLKTPAFKKGQSTRETGAMASIKYGAKFENSAKKKLKRQSIRSNEIKLKMRALKKKKPVCEYMTETDMSAV